jgi:phospholipid transport system substrate-binding protein
MKRRYQGTLLIPLLSFSMLAPLPLYAADTSAGTAATARTAETAQGEVRATIDGIVKVVESLPGDDNARERRKKLRELINPRFDFEEMARRSLGSSWNQATAQEQDEFVTVFSDLLARTYLNRIETVRSGMVKIEGEEQQQEKDAMKTVVKTMVRNKGEHFPIHYKLLKRAGAWKVYDVVIENMGLVANYRNEFASIIRREKMEGLLKRLREKNAAAEA